MSDGNQTGNLGMQMSRYRLLTSAKD